MALLKHGRFEQDRWIHASRATARDDHVIVSLDDWRQARADWLQRNAAVGIRLASADAPESIADDVARFGVIALEFPKFTDGRAYSTARLLRERYGFTGELRAVGHVLRDQYAFMRRVGFDAFEIADGEDIAGWQAAEAAIADVYQTGIDGRRPVAQLRQDQRPASALSAGLRATTLLAVPAHAVIETVAAHWAY